MTRRFDIIAKAYPLHAQRIAEASNGYSENCFNWLMKDFDGIDDAYSILQKLFVWSAVEEPFGYWYDLSVAGREVR